jgi:ribose 5-phosphate isomerase B
MKLVMGSDHAGFCLRRDLARWARAQGHEVEECGAEDDTPYDYPDVADEVARRILQGEAEMGILMCGTGIGVCIRANRHSGIRAALACSPGEAILARQHNHANVLCLGGRTISHDRAQEVVSAFLSASPDDQERHVRRVAKLDADVGMGQARRRIDKRR